MKTPDIAFHPADRFSRAELAALWNRAYEHYFVPVAFDEQRLGRHLRRADVDLAQSRVLVADGEPAGLALVGRRQARAYLAGFGIVSAQRRRGLARRLIQAQLAALEAEGAEEIVLEVIEQNPARMLYAEAGFEALRSLHLLEGVLLPRDAASETLDRLGLADAHERCGALLRPTWRREWRTVLDAVEHEKATAIGVRQAGVVQAYAVLPDPARHDGTVLDAAATDETAAHALLDALSAARPGTRWRLVDEPEGSPLLSAAGARGLGPALRQIEMRRPL
jgi:ribosomal protein S18 acetylase RimI-like enzyme